METVGGAKPDLDSPEEIGAFVKAFYAQVAGDLLLGPVFGEQAKVSWPEHIDKLTAFWCKLELGLPGFDGAPTQKHNALSAVKAFRKEQFARWVELFLSTVNRGWEGPHATSIMNKAVAIAQVQSKLVVNAEPWNPADASTL